MLATAAKTPNIMPLPCVSIGRLPERRRQTEETESVAISVILQQTCGQTLRDRSVDSHVFGLSSWCLKNMDSLRSARVNSRQSRRVAQTDLSREKGFQELRTVNLLGFPSLLTYLGARVRQQDLRNR